MNPLLLAVYPDELLSTNSTNLNENHCEIPYMLLDPRNRRVDIFAFFAYHLDASWKDVL